MRGHIAAILLAASLAAPSVATAHGWGFGDGGFPPHPAGANPMMPMMGFGGPGYGMMGPGYGMMGPGYGMMGPGYGMMGPGYGMMGPGYGMMWPGYGMTGPGYGMMGQGYGAPLDLSAEALRAALERWVAASGNPRLKLGEVKEEAEAVVADVVTTTEGALVDRLRIDRRTGLMQRLP